MNGRLLLLLILLLSPFFLGINQNEMETLFFSSVMIEHKTLEDYFPHCWPFCLSMQKKSPAASIQKNPQTPLKRFYN